MMETGFLKSLPFWQKALVMLLVYFLPIGEFPTAGFLKMGLMMLILQTLLIGGILLLPEQWALFPTLFLVFFGGRAFEVFSNENIRWIIASFVFVLLWADSLKVIMQRRVEYLQCKNSVSGLLFRSLLHAPGWIAALIVYGVYFYVLEARGGTSDFATVFATLSGIFLGSLLSFISGILKFIAILFLCSIFAINMFESTDIVIHIISAWTVAYLICTVRAELRGSRF